MVTLAHLKDRQAGSTSQENIQSEDIVVLNMHFDHRGKVSREKAAELILAKARMYEQSLGEPPLLVAMGDLNSTEDEESYQTISGHRYSGEQPGGHAFLDAKHAVALRSTSKESFALLKQPYGSQGTFTGFQKKASGETIDFILLADNGVVGTAGEACWQVVKYGVLPNLQEDGLYPFRASDHCMVAACLTRRRSS
jgi:endonuclease/exonuclease/phosphatase family metal-dependent hydrolase